MLRKVMGKIFKKKKPLTVDRDVLFLKRHHTGKRTFSVRPGEPQRVNVFIATVDPANFFGGYLAMYNVAKTFADCGHKVRILIIEQRKLVQEDLEKTINHDKRLMPFLREAEFVPCCNEDQEVFISERDIFVATSIISARIASEAAKRTIYPKFIFLAQEYESIFFEHGHYTVLAAESYKLDYYPIISTELLQRFFVENGIIPEKEKGSFINNPVLKFDLPEDFARRKRQGKKKLLFYARTQSHATRNLYPICCLALDRARELGYFQDDEWEVIGIGAGVGPQLLPSGLKINHIGKFDMQSYGEVLPQHDLGLSLMLSPHPSLLPMEMAAAGMLVVTNTFDIKDQEYFHRISPNITAVSPGFESIAQALIEASQRVDDREARLAGSRINWPHTWEEALPASLVQQAVAAVIASAKR
ncbi:MAG TPA: hypothetical protein VJ550_04900 [Geomonas sp.]|nr:hypothetical protein [Geomonas sp.]